MDIEEVSKEVPQDWRKVVLDEYLKRNKDRVETYRIIKRGSADGISLRLFILLFFAVILYLLYKLQLPYEMIIWILISIICMYFYDKYIAVGELNILGKSDHPIDTQSDEIKWKATWSLPPIVPFNNEFIKYIKHIKVATYLLGLTVITISLLIFFIWDTLSGSEPWLLILGLIVLATQHYHMGFKLLDGIDERLLKVGKEMKDLADEMEKEGLISRDSRYDEYVEIKSFQQLAKNI